MQMIIIPNIRDLSEVNYINNSNTTIASFKSWLI